jgi:8-oxo-dGTP diphosphatase
MIEKYVAGFLFDDDKNHVALIHKTHGPAAVVNRWNAIGGKVSTGSAGQPESSDVAMWREFLEEAGVSVDWTLFLSLSGPGWEVDFYHAFSTEKLKKVKTMEAEEVVIFPMVNLPDEIVPNLRWILPMAVGHQDDHVWLYKVIERETFSPRKGEGS